MTQTFTKNPNSGYLNPSTHPQAEPGSFFGTVEIAGVKWKINVSADKINQGDNSVYKRATFNPWTAEDEQRRMANVAKYNNTAPAQQPAVQPVTAQQAYAPQPPVAPPVQAGAVITPDDIPF